MNNLICPTCGNDELEVWDIRKFSASLEGKILKIPKNPDEHSITHIYCENCDPGHGNNLAHKLNDEIYVWYSI